MSEQPESEKSGLSGKSIRDDYIDVPFSMEAEMSRLDIQAGPLSAELKHGEDGGVGILQSGDMLYLIQGLLREDGTKANIGQDLTPDQARALAAALEDAADEAESTDETGPSVTSDEGESIMERISRVWSK